MAMGIFLETALSSIFFFGCEATVISQAEIVAPVASSWEQCKEVRQADGIVRGLSDTLLDEQCKAVQGRSESLTFAGQAFVGQLGQNSNVGASYNNPRDNSSGAIGPAQPDPNGPSVVLIANPNTIQPGNTAQLHWQGVNVDDCTASEGWSGDRETIGSESTGTMAATTNFVLTCNSPNGFVSNAATVWVMNENPAPTVTLTATPENISGGTTSTLTWSTTDVDSCTASDAWSGPRPTAGTESSGILEQTSQFTLNCTGPGGNVGTSVVISVDGVQAPPATFTRQTIMEDQAPWGKNLADVDGDGALDILQGGGALNGNVYWFRAPTWQQYQIGTTGGGDDLQTGDINGDGAVDVIVNRSPIGWYENPVGSGGNPQDPWVMHTIGDYRSHDLEIVDMNNDGKLDVVIRLAGVTSHTTRVLLQGSTADDWITVGMSNDENGTGGLAVADIDDDGRLDIVGDGYWLRQPAQNVTSGSDWLQYPIHSWPAGSSIDTADINGDGNVDVTLAVSEVGVGDLAWFEAPDDPLTQPWIRHIIGTVEDVHRHHLVDMNNDGELDIVFAEMYQSATDRVGIYYNDGNGQSWTLQVIETHGSHNIAVGDIGNDGDMDILGANWRLAAPADGDVFLWINDVN